MSDHEAEMDRAQVVAALRGSRAMVGVIADSLMPALEQVTMPQFRALVLLRALGPTPAGTLASQLGVTASTGTRLVARLVRGGWVERDSDASDRRLITLELTGKGKRLVDETRLRRERSLVAILGRLQPADREAVLDGFRRFADAAGEPSPESLDLLALDRSPLGGGSPHA
jgi:DNA-binding MarR family transcriptional regulator